MTGASFWVRAAMVAVALPLFFVLIFVLPHLNHLALTVGVVAAAVWGAREIDTLLKRRGASAFPYLFLLAAVFPAAAYLEGIRLLDLRWAAGLPVLLVTLVLLRTLWVRRREDLAHLLQRTASSLLVLIYPALFLSFIVRLAAFRDASLVLLFFFSVNFANDIMAYLIGMLLGGSTRLNYLVSPNKSVLGFAAGLAGSIGITALFRALLPGLLALSYPAACLFGGCLGILTVLGDLVESALKRSAQVKDSGGIIPGRGGILDSIDSWLLTAPVVYFVFLLI